jgi:hypothetical protein
LNTANKFYQISRIYEDKKTEEYELVQHWAEDLYLSLLEKINIEKRYVMILI